MNSPHRSTPSPSSDSGPAGTPDSGGSLTEIKNQLTPAVQDVASRIKDGTSRVLNQAKEKAGGMAMEKKAAAADAMGSYSSSIHDTARSLEEKDPNIAWFTHQAADKLQSVADYMRSRNLATLRDDVEGIARRHPAAFFGGLFVAGLVIGNLVKASRQKFDAPTAPEHADPETTESRSESAMPPDYREAERAAAEMPRSAPLSQ